MRHLLPLLVLLAGFSSYGDELKMADGEIIAFESIKKTEPDGLVVLTDSGVSKIRFSKMSEEDKLRFGYDHLKEVTYKQQIQSEKIKRQREVRRVAEQFELRKEQNNKTNSNPSADFASQGDATKPQKEEYNMNKVRDEAVSEMIGIVGDRTYNVPVTEKGRAIFLKIPLIQTHKGISAEIDELYRRGKHQELSPLRTWMREQTWMAGDIATCCSMVLKSFGDKTNPREVYCLASREKYNPLGNQYQWEDYWYTEVANGLATIGYNWVFNKNRYRNTRFDFVSGLQEIKNNLDNGCPVIASVTWDETRRDKFRAALINGYDENEQVVYVTDPSIAAPGLRIISYNNFAKVWHTLDGTDMRYIMFTSFKK
jgi:hypothetical protein